MADTPWLPLDYHEEIAHYDSDDALRPSRWGTTPVLRGMYTMDTAGHGPPPLRAPFSIVHAARPCVSFATPLPTDAGETPAQRQTRHAAHVAWMRQRFFRELLRRVGEGG
jgi:hypothetical protein